MATYFPMSLAYLSLGRWATQSSTIKIVFNKLKTYFYSLNCRDYLNFIYLTTFFLTHLTLDLLTLLEDDRDTNTHSLSLLTPARYSGMIQILLRLTPHDKFFQTPEVWTKFITIFCTVSNSDPAPLTLHSLLLCIQTVY